MTTKNSRSAKQKCLDAPKGALADAVFLKACRLEPTDRTPVWLMRQAGRFMPEYRLMREKFSFLDLCRNSDAACEVTVMAAEKLKVDAAIIFADILLPLVPMGVGLAYARGDGPQIEKPINTLADVEKLKPVEPQEDLAYVMKSIELARANLPDHLPLIGFAGAPFTLASYMIEGGSSRQFTRTKAFMYRERRAWDALMSVLAETTIKYLNAQIDAGAQALQIFDSWVGCLSPADYLEYVLPHVRRTISGITAGVPVIHFGTGTASLLELMRDAGGSVIGLDWRVDLLTAWQRIGFGVGVQGNLDPAVLLAEPEEIKRRAKKIIALAGGRPGHIFNLGHGVLPETPPENVRYLVEVVNELGSRK